MIDLLLGTYERKQWSTPDFRFWSLYHILMIKHPNRPPSPRLFLEELLCVPVLTGIGLWLCQFHFRLYPKLMHVSIFWIGSAGIIVSPWLIVRTEALLSILIIQQSHKSKHPWSTPPFLATVCAPASEMFHPIEAAFATKYLSGTILLTLVNCNSNNSITAAGLAVLLYDHLLTFSSGTYRLILFVVLG